MRPIYDKLIQVLIAEFSRMPTIGTRTAERLAYYVLKRPKEDIRRLLTAIQNVSEKVIKCSLCNNFTEQDPCEICRGDKRDQRSICVVEEPPDLVAIEKTGKYNGLYHVLLGVLSPLDGIGPENLQIDGLIARIKGNSVREVILATNTTTEGETTALYLANLIKKAHPDVAVSRIAYGLAVGANLEYIDVSTISKSMEGRRIYSA